MDKHDALHPEPPRATVLVPTADRSRAGGFDILVRNLLRQREVRMIGKRFTEFECALAHGVVQGSQLGGARAELEVDHIGHGKDLNLQQFDVKRRGEVGKGADFAGGHRPVDHQRAGRQNADVGTGIIVRDQFPAQIIQEAPQGIGNVTY